MDTINVLLIEDDPDDVDLTRRVLKRQKLTMDLSVAENGEEALLFLEKKPPYENAVVPDIILLDLNMPKMDGREFLKVMKANDDWAQIPVVILTTSDSESDILKSYKLHANCYITKPVSLEGFSKAVQKIEEFWFTIVKLPPTKQKFS